VIALSGLASTVWSIVQNAYLYQCPVPLPEVHDRVECPSLLERVSWNIPGLFGTGAMLAFGLWTYRKGKEGVPLISIR
jgi:hypothetical protein